MDFIKVRTALPSDAHLALIEQARVRHLSVVGLSPLEAVQAATLNPAKFLGEADAFGTIAPGKRADLVLLDANPLDDIRNVERINMVVVGGQLFTSEDLGRLRADALRGPRREETDSGLTRR